MTVSLPFQQEFTWRKLGYLFFQDSLAYREILEQNPQWEVTTLPPIGAQLEITGANNGNGGLTQGTYVSGLVTGSTREDIYPFDSINEYITSLNRYTLQGVINRDSLNGYTLDTPQSITGNQRG